MGTDKPAFEAEASIGPGWIGIRIRSRDTRPGDGDTPEPGPHYWRLEDLQRATPGRVLVETLERRG